MGLASAPPLTVAQAQALIEKNVRPLEKAFVPLSESLGRVIAEDVRTPIALPPFHNSAMDGFVLKSRDTLRASMRSPVALRIRGTIKAGDRPKRGLRSGEAYKIMTGSIIPTGGDSILVKEKAFVRQNRLILHEPLRRGKHIRYRGEELKAGRRVLAMQSVIDSGTLGFLASLGKSKIAIFRKPTVSVIATGSELTPPGRPLKPGHIYDSNSFMIASALRNMGLEPALTCTVGDRLGDLRKAFGKAVNVSDVVILMGGVSVGDYDYVKDVLNEFGVRNVFWRVHQKPGKPIYFGKKGRKFVFGLPGNPASVFTCFYEYVFPALRRMSGFRHPQLTRRSLAIRSDVRSDEKRFLFLKGKVSAGRSGDRVTPLKHQSSHMISSLCEADCFILIPPKRGVLKKGTRVWVDVLPGTGNGAS